VRQGETVLDEQMPYKDPEQHRENSRKYRAEHLEQEQERVRKWRAEHPEKSRECARRYRAENTEQHRESVHKWQAANPEKKKELMRRWNTENPEKKRQMQDRYRALKRGATIGDVDLEFVWNRHNGICSLCGKAIDRKDCHFDHVIPLSKGGEHSTDNLRPTHSFCNISKKDRLIKWIQKKLF
jgi:5-methylcytosine-specific restriction endonuclease McrA